MPVCFNPPSVFLPCFDAVCNRVPRLSEFSHFGRLLPLGSFIENCSSSSN
jgi:hypothetical protein